MPRQATFALAIHRDLDLAGRRAAVKAKGARAKARRREQAREDFVLETVCWDVGTARLLLRLVKGRPQGPVFVTHRRPGPGESPPLLQALPRGDRRTHELARTGRRTAVKTAMRGASLFLVLLAPESRADQV